ncbi:MAG TPA: NAD-dependent epimerase/dehydratase family protein [Pyrinomonadaceae bacterium]|nr:NAD-dependent epimerase/dehydratase family protein [Pyrinomonadaceae bacterium]
MKSTFWRDRRTFVTGATGMLGGWTVQQLIDLGADVVCLMRDWVPQSELVRLEVSKKASIVNGDVRDQGLVERILAEYEVDTVFHFAAQTIVSIANRNPVSTFESNIQGTWSLLEACRRSPLVKQIVVASSDKAYGEHDVLPYQEDTPLNSRHPYDVSKTCADLIAQSYAHTFALPIAITRCGNFYGGGDLNWNRIVPGTVRSILRGQPPIIRSDGQYIRDYLYVEDGAAANILLAERLSAQPELRGQAFNFSNESQISVTEMVDHILARMESDLRPEIRGEADNEIRRQYLSAGKARRMLGWSANYDLDAGLEKTIAWYRDFLNNGQ